MRSSLLLLASAVLLSAFASGAATNVTTTEEDCSKTCSCSWLEFIPCSNDWSQGLKATLYMCALVWCFLGVAIVADLFMEAIEMITSKTTERVMQDSEGKMVNVEVLVWNGTIANLTLMAFGSSAPEILLSVIETVSTLGKKPGKLGPSTIVGSAAFNLLCISAVCIMAIPQGQTKKVEQFGVFMITASASMFAYFWMLVVLSFNTKDHVDLWEAIITFLFFPVLVGLAYGQDCNWGRPGTELEGNKSTEGTDIKLHTGDDSGDSACEVGCVSDSDQKSPEQHTVGIRVDGVYVETEALEEARFELAVQNANKKFDNNPTQAQIREEYNALKNPTLKHVKNLSFRLNAVRKMTGQRTFIPDLTAAVEEEQIVVPAIEAPAAIGGLIQFKRRELTVKEGSGSCTLWVLRKGNTDKQVSVRCRTLDGYGDRGAKAGEDYEPVDTTLDFAPGETEKKVEVKIIDDDEPEDDEIFRVELLEPKGGAEIDGDRRHVEVTILDDDNHGTIGFKLPKIVARENCGAMDVELTRTGGSKGKIKLMCIVEESSAREGVNYKRNETIKIGGEEVEINQTEREGAFSFPIEFDEGDTDTSFQVELIDTHSSDLEVHFTCVLQEDKEFKASCQFKDTVISRASRSTSCVLIDNGSNASNIAILKQAVLKVDAAFDAAGRSSWAKQFRDAIELHSDTNAKGEEIPLQCADYVMHLLSLFWKILFAVVPPTHMAGGWASFGVSLALIGALTAVVGELASLFGCNVGLEDEVTAITFVALGTSLPDTFASAQAATQSDTADNAIGNVTGSNAVNVFFGLGLPWVIACAYTLSYPNADGSTAYYYPAGSLSFSVIVFLICAIICFILLVVKRFLDFGELGGTTFLSRTGVALVFYALWFIYVLLSSLLVYGNISNPFD